MESNSISVKNTNNAIMSSMSLSLLAKLLGLAQSVVVSYAFGTNTATDILFYTLSLIVLLTTFQESVNRQIVVPNLVEIKSVSSEEDTRGFISTMYLLYLVAGMAGTAVLLISPGKVLGAISRFNMAEIAENLDIIRLIVPAMFLIIINTYLLDIFTSYRFFNLPMFLDMLKNALIIAFVILLGGRFSVVGLAAGVLAGNLVQFVVLNLLLLRVLKWRPVFRIFKLSGTVRKNIFYVLAGRAATFLNDFIIMYLMSGFAEGIYSAMDYALRIDAVVNSVIIGQISTVVGINIMELHSMKKMKELGETYMKYLKFSFFAVFPVTAVISLNAYPVISLLFERGSFSFQAAETTGTFLRLFILTMPFELMNSFVVILIIAKQIQRVAFLWQISQSLLNILLIWLMVGKYGFYGYPLGVLLATVLYVSVLSYFLVKSQFEFIDAKKVLSLLGRNLAINLPLLAAAFYISPKMQPGGGFADKAAFILLSSVLFLLAYLGVNWLAGFNRGEIKRAVSYLAGLGIKLIKSHT